MSNNRPRSVTPWTEVHDGSARLQCSRQGWRFSKGLSDYCLNAAPSIGIRRLAHLLPPALSIYPTPVSRIITLWYRPKSHSILASRSRSKGTSGRMQQAGIYTRATLRPTFIGKPTWNFPKHFRLTVWRNAICAPGGACRWQRTRFSNSLTSSLQLPVYKLERKRSGSDLRDSAILTRVRLFDAIYRSSSQLPRRQITGILLTTGPIRSDSLS